MTRATTTVLPKTTKETTQVKCSLFSFQTHLIAKAIFGLFFVVLCVQNEEEEEEEEEEH